MYPKELLPWITTFAGNQGVAPAGVVIVAPAATAGRRRWLLAALCGQEDAANGVAVRLENAALVPFAVMGFRFAPLVSPICRPLPDTGNDLQWRNLSGALGQTLAWTVVVADAPHEILSGASEQIINNRQGWGA